MSRIFVFVIQQYNLVVCVDFSLICSDPNVSHLLAGIAMSIVTCSISSWKSVVHLQFLFSKLSTPLLLSTSRNDLVPEEKRSVNALLDKPFYLYEIQCKVWASRNKCIFWLCKKLEILQANRLKIPGIPFNLFDFMKEKVFIILSNFKLQFLS